MSPRPLGKWRTFARGATVVASPWRRTIAMERGARPLKNVVQRSCGFTLVELMVAMSLAVLDMAPPPGVVGRARARAAGRRRFAGELGTDSDAARYRADARRCTRHVHAALGRNERQRRKRWCRRTGCCVLGRALSSQERRAAAHGRARGVPTISRRVRRTRARRGTASRSGRSPMRRSRACPTSTRGPRSRAAASGRASPARVKRANSASDTG